MKLVLDTSAYSAFMGGDRRVREALSEAEKIYVPAIVLGELLAGFATGSRRVQNEQELREFLASSRVEVWPVTDETARRYATVYAALRKKGRPIPTNDLWIAATVLEAGGLLVSLDAHFSEVEALPTY
ncbi:MAG: type II toxin-antitoxin system VapC family toxin [Deltaproteobacteria bacterium]|nr:type II toxin-antitoxin system VapC family toxin [Deltaproteobacteria bacterium]